MVGKMRKVVQPSRGELAQTVREWFHAPFEGMGYRAERRPWGTYWSTGNVYVHDLAPQAVGDLLTDIRRRYDQRPVYITVDDEQMEEWLGPLLLEDGCPARETDIFLAHVGEVQTPAAIAGLETEPVTESNLHEYADTKLRAFADTEEEPDEAALHSEIERRRADLNGTGTGLLARVRGEPAGIIWWYVQSRDVWINSLATRLPFRHQGIGRAILCRFLAHAYAQLCRSVVINVREDNEAAIRLYREVGFKDIGYRRRRYVVEA